MPSGKSQKSGRRLSIKSFVNLLKQLWNTIKRLIRASLSEREEGGGKVWLFLKTYAPLTKVIILDSKYEILNKDELEEIVRDAYQKVRELIDHYKIDEMDCDDYAFAFYTFAKIKSIRAIGVGASKIHAFNIAIAYDNDMAKLYLIEPQTGEMWEYEEKIKEDPKYKLENFVLL